MEYKHWSSLYIDWLSSLFEIFIDLSKNCGKLTNYKWLYDKQLILINLSLFKNVNHGN